MKWFFFPIAFLASPLLAAKLPEATLQEGYTLSLAAASPLVKHPMMGCLDERGRLFVGDAVGVNWTKAELNANPPNRVLMLEDTDHDGSYDKSTVFADKMTFPQGACWLKGSLYVASPPSLWKLTDTNDDGVADKREEIVTGFDYTGNAADIHGPFLHPNGRLFWCHGRKGHKVTQKDGTLVDESLACGIWSCLPDGRDVQWFSLGCGDNPVEVDFTPEGDVIGVQNLYGNQPRADTLMHWLYGGVYERADQMQAISHLSRTLEKMPVMHDFGHVAVSGCCFWRSYPSKAMSYMVTHFNTQRLVRMELTPQGSSYKATENEFLKLHNPDIHLTDVMEDPRNGSLLLIDTGGWFRLGCPSSLMAKADLLGAIYRIKPNKAGKLAVPISLLIKVDLSSLVADLRSDQAAVRRRALENLVQDIPKGWERGAAVDPQWKELGDELRQWMREPLDPPFEHSLILAAQKLNLLAISLEDLKTETHSAALRRMLASFVADDAASAEQRMEVAANHLDSKDADLARLSLHLVTKHPDADEWGTPKLQAWLKADRLEPEAAQALQGCCAALITKPQTQALITALLLHSSQEARSVALKVLGEQTAGVSLDAWKAPLEQMLLTVPSPAVFEAIKKLKSSEFDAALQALAADAKRPLSLRLKALDAVKSLKLAGPTFDMVKAVLEDAASSASAKIQAANMIASASLSEEQMPLLAPLLAIVGPVELKSLLPLLKRHKKPELARLLATEIATNPAIASQQESAYRSALADYPPEIFETVILPAYEKAVAFTEAKKRQLGPLADKAQSAGDAVKGAEHFKLGKGSCVACHKIGDVGRAIGPDLSKIGAIRTERDLLESILFPSNTLARDYEAHIFETSDGQQSMGLIKSHTAEGLLIVDLAGQEKTLPHHQIIADVVLTTSLMPMGLDQTMPENELLDLVAYLRSLR
jgi:putative membrane-bound dehydrogenase-like protein